jgi:hypothetical protein
MCASPRQTHNLRQSRSDVRLMKFRRHPGLSVGALAAARLIAAASAKAGVFRHVRDERAHGHQNDPV